MSRQYTQADLAGKTKRELHEIMDELGLKFENGLAHGAYIDKILGAQAAKQPSAVNGAETADQARSAEEKKLDDQITVTSGASSRQYNLAGQTVANIRKRLVQIMNIDPAAEPWVNSEKTSEEYMTRAGDRLEFVKKSGAKAF